MAIPLKLNYLVDISESADVNGDFIIQGTAITATTTSNNHKFLSEELISSAGSLNGVPLLVDHKNEVDAIKGRVMIGEYDEMNDRVNFKAKVSDKSIREMIQDGRINSVSVGAEVGNIEEGEDGVLIPRGIIFRELSLVAVPADQGATFGIALKCAYDLTNAEPKLKEKNHILTDERRLKEIEMEQETVQNTVKEENNTLLNAIKELTAKVSSMEAKLEESDQDNAKEEAKEEVKAEPEAEAEVKAEVAPEAEKEADKPVEKEAESEIKSEVETEEAEDVEEANYSIEEGFGSIKGSSFSIVRR